LLDALLARCRFPPAGTVVTCAVSGGADSLALLALAVRAGASVTAVHVDHGLRPGSAAEADVVRAAAEAWGAGFRAERAEVAPVPNLEARARAARYGLLPAGVLTGHTADDQAETVLLHVLRGAGLDGLAAMAPDGPSGRERGVGPSGRERGVGPSGRERGVGPSGRERGVDRRPLLALRRHETRALCARLGVTPVQDPSNVDPAFVRNRIRHEVLPLLADVASRDVVPLLGRLAEHAREAVDHLDAEAADLDVTDARALAGAPVALAHRAVRAWLAGADDERHPPTAATVARVLAVARLEAAATDVGAGWRVTRSAGRLRLEPRAAELIARRQEPPR
jgi:tRNA(Ile)-lysidine synthase